MIVLGLTGSIGMGKSTVAAMMNALGIPVHDSDLAAHRLLEPKSEARLAIAAAFPHYQYPQIYEKKTYNINRRELGKSSFRTMRHGSGLKPSSIRWCENRRQSF